MHLILAPLYNLLHDDTFFHWIEEHESVFIFKNLTHTCELTLPKKTFFIIVDASAIGVCTVLVKADD